MPPTQWERLSTHLVPLRAGMTTTHPALHLVSLNPLPACETLPTNQSHTPSMGTRGNPPLLVLQSLPSTAHSAPLCNLHVACLLALSAFFPNYKYICIITAANFIQSVLGIVCLAIFHYLGWGLPLSLQELIS